MQRHSVAFSVLEVCNETVFANAHPWHERLATIRRCTLIVHIKVHDWNCSDSGKDRACAEQQGSQLVRPVRR